MWSGRLLLSLLSSFKGEEWRRRKGATEGCDFQKCAALTGIVIRLENAIRSGDSQTAANKWLTFTSACDPAGSLQCFLLTYINMVRSIPWGLQSHSGVCHVPVLSFIKQKPGYSKGMCGHGLLERHKYALRLALLWGFCSLLPAPAKVLG